MSERVKALQKISAAQLALMEAKTPEQTKFVEAMAAAGKAYAKENGYFEGVVEAERIYLLARRKTTELIRPHIHKFHGNMHVGDRADAMSLIDFGFDISQWWRRVQEFKVREDQLNAYFDDCIEKHCEPSGRGLLRFVSPAGPKTEPEKSLTPLDRIMEAIQEVSAALHAIGTTDSHAQYKKHLAWAKLAESAIAELHRGATQLVHDLEKDVEGTK